MNNGKRTLVVISNQYMLSQFDWYHSEHPEDVCDAVIINFDSDHLVGIMEERCKASGVFENVYVYNNLLSDKGLVGKVMLMLKYVFLNVTFSKRRYDINMVKQVTGRVDYEKVIVPSNFITFSTAVINAFRDSEIICMEDGFSDYCVFVDKPKFFSLEFILKWIIAKLDILNYYYDVYRFEMKNDKRMIKYCALPEKMKYRGYKELRTLFEGQVQDEVAATVVDEFSKYNVVVFSTIFDTAWIEDSGLCYAALKQWLMENYSDKAILIKKHPREKYDFNWDGLNVKVYDGSMSGEEIIRALPECEIILSFTSTMIFELEKQNRDYKILWYKNITNCAYSDLLKMCSSVVEADGNKWIYLG